MDITKLLGADSSDPFDAYVPIIQTPDNRHTDVYLTDSISYPYEYDKLCHTLGKAQHGDTVTFHINNGGGIIDSAFRVIDAMKSSKAHIVAKLSGTVASAATVISLAADELVIADYTSFMVHNYSGGAVGKGHEIKAQQEFIDRELNFAFREIYQGFLTEKEMTQVINGRDVWLNKKEVLARWHAKRNPTDQAPEQLQESRKRGRPSRKVD